MNKKNTDSGQLLPLMCSTLIRCFFPRKVEWNVYVYFGYLSTNPEPLCLSQFHCHLSEKAGHWAGVAEPWSHHLPAWLFRGDSHPSRGAARNTGAPLAAAAFQLCMAVHR